MLSISREKKILLLSNAVILYLALFLKPFMDDWFYLTVPRFDEFNFFSNRRVFDNLYGLFLGRFPWLFPNLNHVIVVFGHTVSTLLFYDIAVSWLKCSRKNALFFAFIFSVGAGVSSTVFSVDALNQSLSLTFGLLGMWLYIKLWDKIIPQNICYIILSICSLLAKESGIVFFLIIPVFGWAMCSGCRITPPVLKRLAVSALLSVFVIIAYFSLFSFNDVISKNIFSFETIKYFIYAMGFSFTQIDTVVFFADANYFLAALTAILSFPVLIIGLGSLPQMWKNRRKNFIVVIILLGITVLTTLPHIQHYTIQEMNAYPTVMFALLTLCLLTDASTVKLRKVALVLYLLVAIVSGTHKYAAIYSYGKMSESVTARLVAELNNRNISSLLFFIVNAFNEDSYGLYKGTPQMSTGYGSSINQVFDWKVSIDRNFFKNNAEKKGNFPQSVFVDMNDEKFKQYLIEQANEDFRNMSYDAVVVFFPNGTVYIAQ